VVNYARIEAQEVPMLLRKMIGARWEEFDLKAKRGRFRQSA
jgi:hypothetical protein